MEWFRCYHETVRDPKFSLIAKRTGATRRDVISVWVYLLTLASESEERGKIPEIDFEIMAETLDFNIPTIELIIGQMIDRKLIDDQKMIKNWKKRQPLSDAERASNYRQKRKIVTERHDESRNVTTRQEHNREEQNITEKTTTPLPPPGESGGGHFFKINCRGDQTTEEEWIFRCFLERRRSNKQSVMGCDSLRAMLNLYPSLKDEFGRWVTLPIETRMAAFVYLKCDAKNYKDAFSYALNTAENGLGWAKVTTYLRQAKQMVEKNDYEVLING